MRLSKLISGTHPDMADTDLLYGDSIHLVTPGKSEFAGVHFTIEILVCLVTPSGIAKVPISRPPRTWAFSFVGVMSYPRRLNAGINPPLNVIGQPCNSPAVVAQGVRGGELTGLDLLIDRRPA